MAEQQQRFVAEDFPGRHLPFGARDTRSGLRTWGWISAANRDQQVANLNADPGRAYNTSWKNDDNNDWMPDPESRARLRAATDTAAFVPNPDLFADQDIVQAIDGPLDEDYRPLLAEFLTSPARRSGMAVLDNIGEVMTAPFQWPDTLSAFGRWLHEGALAAVPTPPFVPNPDFVADLDNRLGEEYRALYNEFQPIGPFPSTTFGSVSNDDHESPATRQAFANWLRRRPDRATPAPAAVQPAWQRLGFINEEAYNNLSTAAAEHADNAGHCGTYDRLAEEVGLLTREQTRHLQDRTFTVTARIATTVTVRREATDREKINDARRALTRAVRDLTDDAVLLMMTTD